MKTKILALFLCFIMIKANGQNLRINFYSDATAQPPILSNNPAYKTSYFDKLFDLVYVNGVLTKNKNFTNAKPMADIPIIPFDKTKSDFPEVIIIDLGSDITSLTFLQAQADCLIKYVNDGGILIGNIEQLSIIETGGSAAEYIANELLCRKVSLSFYSYGAHAENCNTIQYKYHPDDGILLLNENGADAVNTTASFDVVIGIPSENTIIGNECSKGITNCKQKEAMEFIIPAYPGLGTNCPNNNFDIKGFAILCGETKGIFKRGNDSQLDKNYIQLIYDFLNDPAAMQKRYAWSNTKSHNNVDCPPTVPTGYSNAVLTTPIPIPTVISSSTVWSNTCPTLTVDLLPKINSPIPTLELRWFKNKSHYGEQYLTVTAATTGTYYAFYFDLSNNCYSLASDPVMVETIACNQCTNDFASLKPTVISEFTGNIIGSHPKGLYWIKSDITITSPTIFENAEILIEPNVTISLIGSRNVELNIKSSHLFTCNGRWNGIVALRNSRVIIDGTDDIANNIYTSTLIEDAEIAIIYHPEVVDLIGDEPILFINNTIFNRNNIGIKITDDFYYSKGLGYNNGFENNNLYRCFIKNTLFTSRKIPFNQGQYDWTNFKILTQNSSVMYPNTPNSYAAPYIDDATFFDYVPEAFLKDPINLGSYTNQKPLAGIVLDNLSYMNLNNEKTSVQIGAETAKNDIGDVSIFDNLQYGIKANDANFIVTNCSFQKPVGVGIGIYADLNGDNFHYDQRGSNFSNVNKVVISKNNGKPANAFFDMNKAICIRTYDEVEVKGCEIRSNQDYTNLAQNGELGIGVSATVFKKIVIEKNNITNIRNGISYGGATEGGQNYIGALEINGNVFKKEFSPNSMPNGFIENAITAGVYFEGKYSNATPLNVKGNKISDAYNGIWLSGWISKNFNVLGNEIHLAIDAAIAPGGKHYGIKVDGGSSANLQYELDGLGNVLLDANGVPIQVFGSKGENLIQDNKIWGAGITPNVGVKPSAGIWLSQQSNTNIGCNHVWTSDNAYKFEGLCLLTKFMDNYIYADNHYGYTLYDGAQIGQQGNDGTTNIDDVCASNNDFTDLSTNWNLAQHKMTYTEDSDPLNSILVIRTGGGYERFNPSGSGHSNSFGFIYGVGNGLLTTTLDDGANCEIRCNNHPVARKIKHSIIELMEEIATGTTTIPNDKPFERLEVMQQQLYELVKKRPELAQNSNDIQQFIYDNQWSSLDFIYYAGYYASKGNMDMVNNLLNNWTPSNSVQDYNYHVYYKWLVSMYNDPKWKPKIEEVLEMANKCPIKDGTIIYAARNLYNALTREIHKFDYACEGNINARGVKNQVEMIRLKQPKANPVVASQQVISIYPNPAKSIVNITTIRDAIKQIELISILGKSVKTVSVNNLKNTQLNITDIPKGIFLVKITTAKNTVITQKLIIE